MRILRQIAKETQQQIQAFRSELNEKYNQLLRPLVAQIIQQDQQQSFADYWNELSIPFAEQLANKARVLPECQARGMAGLLEVRSVKLATLAQLSLGYANTYERGAVERGDSRDMQHAVLASAVTTLVRSKACTSINSNAASRLRSNQPAYASREVIDSNIKMTELFAAGAAAYRPDQQHGAGNLDISQNREKITSRESNDT